MPNHVTNKIVFSKEKLDLIKTMFFTGENFDFNKIIPQPVNLYQGNLSSEDEEDFHCNWYSWNRDNWGTKWNAYDSCAGVDGDLAFISFDTAWNIPYPIIVAFANTLKIDFELKYFDEGHNFWGIEKWGVDEGGNAYRLKKSKNNQSEFVELWVELKGYNPEEETED